ELSQMCKNSAEPIFITKNGYGDMVIMSMEMYEKLMLIHDVYSKLDEAEEQVRQGKTLDADEDLKKMKQQ
ncbi:MAG: type II toxin-antitoxin system prevent-host-death family antitoxin, partial [Clostridia bacterium]|nr:type II toxin-antitoxin system prevent-host-death family antitoxin [Clostridia bacterium]